MVLAEPNRELKRPIKILREFHPSKNVFLYTMHTRAFLCPKWWVRATIKAKKKDDYWPPIQPFFDKDYYSLYVVAPFSYFRILVCLSCGHCFQKSPTLSSTVHEAEQKKNDRIIVAPILWIFTTLIIFISICFCRFDLNILSKALSTINNKRILEGLSIKSSSRPCLAGR